MRCLLMLILVCKVFSWGAEGPAGVTPEINAWLKDKKFVSSEQSSVAVRKSMSAGDVWIQTYLTIIAEV